MRDRAGCMWIFGAGFALGGATITAMLIGPTEGKPTGWALLAAAAIGVAHMAAGGWMIVANPNIRVLLRNDGRTLRIVRRWPFRRTVRELHVDHIMHATLREMEDSDGDPVYHLELYLRTGERITLQSIAQNTREPVDAALAKLREWSANRILVRNERGAPLTPERG